MPAAGIVSLDAPQEKHSIEKPLREVKGATLVETIPDPDFRSLGAMRQSKSAANNLIECSFMMGHTEEHQTGYTRR